MIKTVVLCGNFATIVILIPSNSRVVIPIPELHCVYYHSCRKKWKSRISTPDTNFYLTVGVHLSSVNHKQ